MNLYRYPSLLLQVDTRNVHIINVKGLPFDFQSDSKGFLHERKFRETLISIAEYTQTTKGAIPISLAMMTYLTFNFSQKSYNNILQH